MKEIALFEAARKNPENYKDAGISYTVYWAYNRTREARNELLDFSEVIWEQDVEEIAAFLKQEEITEFTISCSSTGLIPILAAFEKIGIKMVGTTEVFATYKDWSTGEAAIIPAIRMEVR